MPLPESITSRKDCWIETISGQHVCVTNPSPLTININDIAHALSMQCRFVGHCKKFYSVAEHCCFVANMVNEQVAEQIATVADKPKLVLRALLHDAAEAYVGDLARPYKVLAPDLRAVELNLQEMINKKFEANHKNEFLNSHITTEVKLFDEVALILEAEHLMPSKGLEYEFSEAAQEQAKIIESHEKWSYWYQEYLDTKYSLNGKLPIVAKSHFLSMFHCYYMMLSN